MLYGLKKDRVCEKMHGTGNRRFYRLFVPGINVHEHSVAPETPACLCNCLFRSEPYINLSEIPLSHHRQFMPDSHTHSASRHFHLLIRIKCPETVQKLFIQFLFKDLDLPRRYEPVDLKAHQPAMSTGPYKHIGSGNAVASGKNTLSGSH